MSIIQGTQISNQRGQFLGRTHAGFSKTNRKTVDYYPVYRTLDTSTNQLLGRNKETAGAIQTLTDALHNQLHYRHSVGESAECENPRRNSSQQTLE
jgi:hypothetical protein